MYCTKLERRSASGDSLGQSANGKWTTEILLGLKTLQEALKTLRSRGTLATPCFGRSNASGAALAPAVGVPAAFGNRQPTRFWGVWVMSLLLALPTLKTTLISLLTVPANYPKNITEFASKWADAYDLYAMQAITLALVPGLTPVPNAACKSAFELALTAIPPISPSGVPAATAFAAAVLAYWNPTLLFFSAPSLVAPPVLDVSIALTAIFSVLSPDGTAKANAIADALHASTITATVTVTGPPPLLCNIT
jgi:hypothetical protein